MNEQKRVQLKDVLQRGYADGQGRAVVEDARSRAIGPNPEKASLIKMLLDSFSDKLQTVGLRLGQVGISWETDESPDAVCHKLRQMNLISDK